MTTLKTELAIARAGNNRVVHDRFPHGRRAVCGAMVARTVAVVPAYWRHCRSCATYRRNVG